MEEIEEGGKHVRKECDKRIKRGKKGKRGKNGKEEESKREREWER